MCDARLVEGETKEAYTAVLVQILQSKRDWVEENNLPHEFRYPFLIVADKPEDLVEPFKAAARAVYGNDENDGRLDVKFARDIFHECQQHNKLVGNRLDKKMYCSDFAQVFSLLRGPKIGIPQHFKYDKIVEQQFLQPGM